MGRQRRHAEIAERRLRHPIGHVTEALLRWWYRQQPEDGQGLPTEIRSTFTGLCNIQLDKFRHGRVLLAAHVIALFRVDRDWATQHLLPLFDWQRSEDEARVTWRAFCGHPACIAP
jgi:hypothetical protein